MSGYYGGGAGQGDQSSNNPYYGQQGGAYGQQQQATSAPQYNAQQWQQQPQQQQQYSQQQQSYPGQQQQPAPAAQPNLFNPAAVSTMAAVAGSMASGNKDQAGAMMDLAGQAGTSIWNTGTARMIPGLQAGMLMLRSYFAVDNHYVVRKMKKVLVPFLSKNGWRRQPKDSGGPDQPVTYALPLIDENAPDLYLPCMSLITYVLLAAVCYGTAGKFDPEIISNVTSKCVLTQVVEVIIMRAGFYMMQAEVAILDLFAYTGYKYLGLCVNMLVGLACSHFEWGTRGFYAAFLWTASAASYFMLKTMSNNIPMVTSASGPKRELMVIGFAAIQFAAMWFVSQTKFL